MSSTTEPTDPMDTAMDAALHANDMEAFHQAFGAFLHADRWMQTHVVHAMAACPAVLDYWLASVPKEGRAERLYRYTARALEDLSEEEKTELLLGKSSVPSRQNLYRFLKASASMLGNHWASLSPIWVGKSGSALQQAALGLGWKPERFHIMLAEGMQHSGWERWLSEVPYAYSIIAVGWSNMRLRGPTRKSSTGVDSTPTKKDFPRVVCSNGANPLDVVLALEIVAQHAAPFAGHLCAPASWQSPPPEEVQRLHDLVRFHWTLGLQDKFVQALREGYLLGTEPVQPPLGLPDGFDANAHATMGGAS